ncbi:MAG: 50S ribosomal protein L20 [Spirochaetota bacterium]|jgi:large subunit ribosomal protein L20|nr:50S ribosomal protein L20 [Spirochaetota bacterium]
MPRAVSGTVHKNRVKSVLKKTKGYRGARSKLYRTAKNAMIHALSYAYIGRKQKKRTFRQLWIARINGFCRNEGITYSAFINGLKKANINIDRKNLSNLAIENPEAFKELIVKAKAALN